MPPRWFLERKSKLKLVSIILAFLTVSIMNNSIGNISNNYEENSSLNPRSSDFWIIESPFVIDDDSLNQKWEDYISMSWLSGEGTADNPYVIENLSIDSSASSNKACIEIRDSDKYFIVRNCLLKNAIGDTFLNPRAGIYLSDVSNGRIVNITCHDNDVGIRGYQTNDIVFLKNQLHHNYYSGFYLVYCFFCNITQNNSSYNYNDDGIFLWQSDNNTIAQNNLTCNQWGIYLYGYSDYNTIFGNNASFNQKNGLHLNKSCAYNTIAENIFKENQAGIYLEDLSNQNEINRNIIIQNVNGIFLNHSDSNVIVENNVSNNLKDGILLHDVFYADVSGNIIRNNIQNGISLDENKYSDLGNNSIRNNNCGLYLIQSDIIDIHDNDLIANNYGAYFNISNSNVIFRSNNVNKNDVIGVFVSENLNTNNLFYENNFIDNTIQAQDNSGVGENHWNSSEIGNYWSDYEGKDIDGDGIGDVPYNISGTPGIQDMKPIVHLQEEETSLPNNDYAWIAIVIFVVIVLGVSGIVLNKKRTKSGLKRFNTTFHSSSVSSIAQNPQKKPIDPIPQSNQSDIETSGRIIKAGTDEEKDIESEVAVIKAQYTCPVHKGIIEGGELYLCRHCKTFYCKTCVEALKKKDESCWSCNKPFE